MWWFLAVVVALQLYFVRELVAALALFVLVFAVIGGFIASLYFVQRAWQVAVVRVADSQHPLVNALRRGAETIEDFARRPLRRPGSAAAR